MAIKKRPISPRQKMINLMYVVLMAMLAINVSSDVLDGFTVIEDSIKRSAKVAESDNSIIYEQFRHQMSINPEKSRQWYNKAMQVHSMSDSLVSLVKKLRREIIVKSDGINSAWKSKFILQNKDNTEATAQVMVSPGTGRGEELTKAVRLYRERISDVITDEGKRKAIRESLSTEVPVSAGGKTWSEYMFGAMPAAAATALLTKMISDIRYAEGEALHSLLANIDINDVRVNSLEAFVIPESKTVIQGSHLRANIVMAAVDTTQMPEVFIGEKKVEMKEDIYDIACGSTGDFTLKGYLKTVGKDGEPIRRDFSMDYSVVAPTATVSADLMNVLYAGYDNPVSVSVPGVPLTQVKASMSGGTLVQKAPGRYIARPAKAGQQAIITVYANLSGKSQQMAQYTFQTRKLPEPSPFISLRDEKGAVDLFRGGALQKTRLIDAGGIGAAVDDGILHIPFRVLSFEAVFFDHMGNAVPVISDGASFSQAQKDTFRRMAKGRRVYISRLKAIGPDGIERSLKTSMEIIIR